MDWLRYQGVCVSGLRVCRSLPSRGRYRRDSQPELTRRQEKGSTRLWGVVCGVAPRASYAAGLSTKGWGDLFSQCRRRDPVGSMRDACTRTTTPSPITGQAVSLMTNRKCALPRWSWLPRSTRSKSGAPATRSPPCGRVNPQTGPNPSLVSGLCTAPIGRSCQHPALLTPSRSPVHQATQRKGRRFPPPATLDGHSPRIHGSGCHHLLQISSVLVLTRPLFDAKSL